MKRVAIPLLVLCCAAGSAAAQCRQDAGDGRTAACDVIVEGVTFSVTVVDSFLAMKMHRMDAGRIGSGLTHRLDLAASGAAMRSASVTIAGPAGSETYLLHVTGGRAGADISLREKGGYLASFSVDTEAHGLRTFQIRFAR